MDITLDQNNTSQDIMIFIQNDDIYERTEQFNGVLSTAIDSRSLILNPGSAIIQIIDDEGTENLFKTSTEFFVINSLEGKYG